MKAAGYGHQVFVAEARNLLPPAEWLILFEKCRSGRVTRVTLGDSLLAPHVFPALAVLLHGVICEVVRGWPTLEFWSNYGANVNPASPFKIGRRATVRCE